MTSNPASCTSDASAQAVALIMHEEDVGIVPIVEGETDRLLGIVTDRDLCLEVVAEGKHPQHVKIAGVMSTHVITCRAADDVAVCLELMKTHQLRRIPIVDEDGRCIGIISQRDIAVHLTQPQEVHETIRTISKPRRAEAA
jgi:CBS domain-containing protein